MGVFDIDLTKEISIEVDIIDGTVVKGFSDMSGNQFETFKFVDQF